MLPPPRETMVLWVWDRVAAESVVKALHAMLLPRLTHRCLCRCPCWSSRVSVSPRIAAGASAL
eukprot:8735993-Heterocapsa_arctica.AAC.1